MPFTSFFCSRQLDSKNSKLLVTTLCRNLAELFSSYASEVLPILKSNSSIVHAELCRQMDELLAKLWKTSLVCREHLQVPVVIVDALDENDRGTSFLEELLRVVESGKLAGIKFLVTSQPEPTLADLCKSFPEDAVCKLHEVDTANVQKDIEKYLCEALPDLKDNPNLAVLAQQAGGLFIYATTAVRFISPYPPLSTREKADQLQSMLNSWPVSDGRDGQLAVDELYDQILGVAFRDDRVRQKRLQILHTVLCAEIRINMSVLADLSDTDEDTAKRVVDSLHAVLFISSKDTVTMSTGIMLLFLIFCSMKDEQSSRFPFIQTIQPTRLMYFVTHLLIMPSWPISASPSCWNFCISTCVALTHHMSLILMCLILVIGNAKISHLLYNMLHDAGLSIYFKQCLQKITPIIYFSASTNSCLTNYYSGLRL